MKRLSHDPRGFWRLSREHEVRACYEASGAGYLERSGAPRLRDRGLVADSPASGRTRKHDRKDAEELARLSAGELVTIRVPTEQRVRDLVRCRGTLQREALKSRHYILKFLARRGRCTARPELDGRTSPGCGRSSVTRFSRPGGLRVSGAPGLQARAGPARRLRWSRFGPVHLKGISTHDGAGHRSGTSGVGHPRQADGVRSGPQPRAERRQGSITKAGSVTFSCVGRGATDCRPVLKRRQEGHGCSRTAGKYRLHKVYRLVRKNSQIAAGGGWPGSTSAENHRRGTHRRCRAVRGTAGE